jgi:hypothetical protein
VARSGPRGRYAALQLLTRSGHSEQAAQIGGHNHARENVALPTKKLLAIRRQPLRNPDIATAFKTGGLVLQSAEPANPIGSVLTRRFNEVGDIVRVGRGTWGLQEWYPNVSFKRKGTSKGPNGEVTEKDELEDLM